MARSSVHTTYVEGLCCHAAARGDWVNGRHGLAGETFQGVPCRMLVAILQEKLGDDVGVDADGAVIAWQHPRRRLGSGQIGHRLSRLRHHRDHVEQLGDAVVDTGLCDDHAPVGVPTQHGRAVGLVDRPGARADVSVEIAEFAAGLTAAGQRHRDAGDAVAGQRLEHAAPPPRRVAHTGAVDEDQRGHRRTLAQLRGCERRPGSNVIADAQIRRAGDAAVSARRPGATLDARPRDTPSLRDEDHWRCIRARFPYARKRGRAAAYAASGNPDAAAHIATEKTVRIEYRSQPMLTGAGDRRVAPGTAIRAQAPRAVPTLTTT
jgi:hypothetical protein